MALLISFKDAVNAGVLDPNATHAVYYCDGAYQNEAAVRARCPHAKLYAITVRGATGHGIFACDSETGDLTVPQTEAWVAEQVRLNVWPTVVYANQDRWLNEGLLANLAHYGDRIERWDADYDGVATPPPWASAKQYATGNVDLDVARANFFDTPPPPAPKVPHGTVRFEGSLNLGTGEWSIHGLPGIHTHFAGEEKWASAEVQINVGAHGGQWRVRGLPFNAPPVGK